MTAPYWQDDHLTIHGGDCREVMAAMPERSVHCVVTSPPYWGLRDYGTATWVGGDEACDHNVRRWDGPKQTQGAQSGHASVADRLARQTCDCGAIRQDGQLGLEATPDAYVEAMVGVFREVRRVLRDDGTVWLNLGDSYAGSSQTGGTDVSGLLGYGNSGTRDPRTTHAPLRKLPSSLKPKDLVGIPWRVAFALQADGWYLRSDIIWSKPNPMPESVTDRPTKAHEYLFLLTKSPKYYYDAAAVREAWQQRPGDISRAEAHHPGYAGKHDDGYNGRVRGQPVGDPSAGRNLRSVWTIPTQPYPGAHFATFPEALVEPCVKAGSPEGGTVLDPFAGSGTTLVVAQRLSRRAVGIDLNPDYLRQCLERNAQTPLGLGA